MRIVKSKLKNSHELEKQRCKSFGYIFGIASDTPNGCVFFGMGSCVL